VDGDPVLRVIRGVPVTVTACEKVTVTGRTWPALYEPSARVELTPVTEGATEAATVTVQAAEVWSGAVAVTMVVPVGRPLIVNDPLSLLPVATETLVGVTVPADEASAMASGPVLFVRVTLDVQDVTPLASVTEPLAQVGVPELVKLRDLTGSAGVVTGGELVVPLVHAPMTASTV
jgi:hypothetical protein